VRFEPPASTTGEKEMGLLEVINGMQNGPRGQPAPKSDDGMSLMTKALLALLAYKAAKHLGGSQPGVRPTGNASAIPVRLPDNSANAGIPGGGLGDLLKGGLGGLLAGGAAGSVLSGGLGDLLKQFQQSGQTEAANSWVGKGPNKQISPSDLAGALGADQIRTLTNQTGLSRDELLSGLSRYLPEVVNHLTPDGRLPTEQEIARLI
jgi:uncharacterized protein YidB (DUF937 family)